MLSKKIFFKNSLTKFSRTSLFNFTKNSLQKIKEEENSIWISDQVVIQERKE